jgi:hypothetical protein
MLVSSDILIVLIAGGDRDGQGKDLGVHTSTDQLQQTRSPDQVIATAESSECNNRKTGIVVEHYRIGQGKNNAASYRYR